MTCTITISGKPLKLPDGWLGCGYRAECSCNEWQAMANHHVDILESVQKHMVENLKENNMVTHEPECPNIPEHFVPEDSILWPAVCHCDTARSAYQRGREDAAKEVNRRYATEFTWDELLAIVRGNGEQE